MRSLPETRARSKAALFFIACAAAGALVSGCGPKPVAAVNGEPLTEKEFARLCETATQVMPQQGSVGMQVLMQWIRQTMLAQEAKRLKVYPSEADLQARVDSYRKQAELSGLNFDDQLKQQGLTPETFKRELLTSMVSENVLFREITVSDAEVQKEFEQRKESFGQPEQVRISQITLDSPDKVKQVQNDLNANTQFPLVASTHSKDQFAQQGGQVPFPLPRQVPPGLPVDGKVVDAAFKLKEGQVSDPIQVSSAAWVVVKLEEKIAEKKPSFDEVKELIRSALRQQKAEASGQMPQIQRGLMEMTTKAKIEIHRPEYQPILQMIKGPEGAAPVAGAGAPPAPPGG